jgi:signal transduction histidine kinase
MIRRLIFFSLLLLIIWLGAPALMAQRNISPITIRALSPAAVFWLTAALALAALIALLWGYGSRSGCLLTTAGAFGLWFGIPLLARQPLIVVRTENILTLIWLGASLMSTAAIIFAIGRALRQDAMMRRALALIDGAMENGLALYDRRGRLRWSNFSARRSLSPETDRLVKRALQTGRAASQSINTDETHRLKIHAAPLGDGMVGVIMTPTRGEPDQFYERFLRRIVHDMRNPLAAIIAHTGNLRAISADQNSIVPADQNSLMTIEHEAQRLTRLVDSILFDARLAYVPLALESIDLLDVIEEVYYQYDDRAVREQKTLQIEIPTESARLEADHDLLVRALSNLVDNSLKYSRPGASVSISLDSSDKQHILNVRDTGDGIPPEYLPNRIFEPLVRARSGDSGSGLGLSIVKKIIDLHNGSISVQSTLGQGTTFTICLPKS